MLRAAYPILALILIMLIGATANVSRLDAQAQSIAPSNTKSFSSPYPTFTFASWNGGGIPSCTWNASAATSPGCFTDTIMQKGLIPEASGVFPWQAVQYASWCDHANTTTTKIPVSTAGFTLYKVNTAQQIMK